jgi:hypothetical protein
MPQCTIAGENCGFQCSGYDGSHLWDKIHKAAQDVECDLCREHGVKLMKFAHDVVNLGLGKKAHDKKNFLEMVNQVNCVAATCSTDGRC